MPEQVTQAHTPEQVVEIARQIEVDTKGLFRALIRGVAYRHSWTERQQKEAVSTAEREVGKVFDHHLRAALKGPAHDNA